MFFIWILYLNAQLSNSAANSTSELHGLDLDQPVACRTERRMYLLYEQYKTDACARCYNYMPTAAFKIKYWYHSWRGLLKNPITNETFEANPLNVSKELLKTFSEKAYVVKWLTCCIAAIECCGRMLLEPPPPTDGLYCPRTWDGWQCWDDTPAGTTAKQPCQSHIYFESDPPSCPKYSYKVCWPNGTWFVNENYREWTNYSKCGRGDVSNMSKKGTNGKWNEDSLKRTIAAQKNGGYGHYECTHMYGVPMATIKSHAYSKNSFFNSIKSHKQRRLEHSKGQMKKLESVKGDLDYTVRKIAMKVKMTGASSWFCVLCGEEKKEYIIQPWVHTRQLQVHRITMHKHLFLSLFLNGIFVLLFKSIVVLDEFNRSPTYKSIMDKNGELCKVLFIFTKYFRMTNYMWMFCEGFYLHKLIAAAFAEQKNLIMFYIIGWAGPIIPVSIYAILRKTTDDEKCWAFPVEPYEWIMNVPNMLSLVVNFFFLCNIIRVLVTKLRATNSNEPSQFRKAVRATLILIPLFGLQFFFVVYRPRSGHCSVLAAYTYFSHATDGLQGFVVSLFFCYMNGEVIYLLKRSYQRYRLTHNLRSQNSIMLNQVSVTQVSTMVDSQNVSQTGLHYRTKIGDHQEDVSAIIPKSISSQENTAAV